jgi:hypothetical protein
MLKRGPVTSAVGSAQLVDLDWSNEALAYCRLIVRQMISKSAIKTNRVPEAIRIPTAG